MGIQGLLPFLKKIHEPVNVSRFAGHTVAIDAYCWLHKGAFSCAEKLALGEKTDQYVYYCMKFLNYMLAQNVKPIMVFDGCHLPSKKLVEKSRREKRDSNRKKAAQFLREGRRAEARECLQRSIDISPDMALNLMNACRERGVDCIVAPYEADAQLAYLNKIGVADVIITEDSDLLLFGCEKVIFKMDHAGNGLLIEKRRLNEVTEISDESYTFDKFRYMCIMSGCDYLASLPGIGLARANKVFKIARQADIQLLLKKLSTYLKSNISVSQDYVDSFVRADHTFLYQLVYDPLCRRLVPLSPYPPDIKAGDLPYAGDYVPQDRALQIALGNVNIYTGERFADFDPDTFVPKYAKKKKPDMLYMRSIWDRAYRPRPKVALHEAQPHDRPLLKGKEVTVTTHLRRSPRKRVRPAEDSPAVRTDKELCQLYTPASPNKKRPRTEEVGDELQRFMFAPADAAHDEDQSEEEEDKDEEVKPVQKTGPPRSPKFFNSLSKAHPGVADLGTSQESESDKENGLKSPTKNVFVTKSPSKKPRFDLNAPKPPKAKKVVSRFFASSQKKDSTSENKPEVSTKDKPSQNDSNQTLISGYRLVHHSDTDKSEDTSCLHNRNKETDCPRGNSGSSRSGSPFTFSKEKSTSSQNSQSPSPGGAFQWSKFKFRSKDGASITSPLASSRVNKSFKKVVSETRLDEFLKSKPKEIEDNEQSSGDKPSVSSVNHGEIISLSSDSIPEKSETLPSESNSEKQEPEEQSESQGASSFPYSIDSYCVDTMQGDSQRSDISGSFINSQESYDSGQSQKQKTCSIYGIKHSKSEPSLNFNKGEKTPLKTAHSSEYFKTDSCSNGNGLATDVVYLLDSDDDTESVNSSTSNKMFSSKCKSTAIQKSSLKGSMKPGCRVSGLSRRPSKKAPPATDSKQQSLKDMFSKFAHTEGSGKPRLSHNRLSCDTEDDPATPEGDSSLIQSRKNPPAQRNLLHAT